MKRALLAGLAALILQAAAANTPAVAQTGYDRPGGDYSQRARAGRRSGGLRQPLRA